MRIKIYKKKKALYILIECFNNNYMQDNPDKFQAIAVGKKTYAKEHVFFISFIIIFFLNFRSFYSKALLYNYPM
jgi:hypothetical protein